MNPRIERWFMELSEFNYTIGYVKDENHLVPDGLSRGAVESASETEVASLHVFGVSINTE